MRTLLYSHGRAGRPHRRTALIGRGGLRCYNIDTAALSETRLLDEGSLIEEGSGYASSPRWTT